MIGLKKKSVAATLCSLLCLILVLSGCSKQPKHDPQKIYVAATTNVYAGMAQVVLGNYGQVTTIIKGNMDPHEFEPTTAVAKEIHTSNLVLANGLGYDNWVSKLNGKKYIYVGSDIMHKKTGDNEHVWYDTKTMAKTAVYLAKSFSQIQPKHRKAFYQNAKRYQATLKPINQTTDQIKKHSHHQPVAVSEPVFNYALAAMGYRVVDEHFAMAIEEGSDPSYSDIKDLQDKIKHHQISFFVVNTQSDSKIVQHMVKLCEEYHIPVIKVTETMPQNKTYQQWMLSQDRQILAIQQKQKQ